MKKIILVLACCSLAVVGCKKKIDELTVVDIDIPYSEEAAFPDVFSGSPFVIPPGIQIPGGLAVDVPQYAFATDVNKYLTLYNTSPDKVNSATLKSFGLRLTSPPTANFNFMDSIQVRLGPKNGPEVLVAYLYNIPRDKDSILLNVSNDNLKTLFLADSLYVHISGFITETPQAGVQLRFTPVFHLNANPI